MRLTTASRKRRSWETTRTAPSKPARNSSSHVEPVRVEVVGRLVEQQDVGVLEQRGGEQRAGLLAARQAAERALGVEVVDAEPAADVLRARLGGPGPGGLGALERVRVGVEVAGALERGERLAGLAERGVQEVVDRDVGRLLRQVADRRGHEQRAAVRELVAGQQAQQRGLAGAVGADEPGAVAGVEGQRQPFEEGRAVIALGQIECA